MIGVSYIIQNIFQAWTSMSKATKDNSTCDFIYGFPRRLNTLTGVKTLKSQIRSFVIYLVEVGPIIIILTGLRVCSQVLRPLFNKLFTHVHKFSPLVPQQVCSVANEGWMQVLSVGTFGHQQSSQKQYPLIVQSHVIETAINPGPFY